MDLEDPEERELAILEVGREAVEAAPDLAAEAIRELRAGSPEARALIYACVTHLMERSPDEALAWAESLEDEALITLARVPIVTVIAQAEPERAIQVLAASNQAAGDWSPELERVLQVWSGRAPADAAAWVTKLPAGESRDAGLKTVVSQWVQADAAASTAWVASLPDSKIRQQSTQAMAESFQGMPSFIRDTILDRADPEIRNEIEYEIEQMEASEETEAEPSGE